MTVFKNKIIYTKIATFLAFFIGIMSVFAGSKVLLKIDNKAYNVLIWLVSYNVFIGVISIITAYFIWKKNGRKFTYFILSSHFLVFIYLQFISTEVASESIKAMIFRITIWILISFLSLSIPKYLSKNKI